MTEREFVTYEAFDEGSIVRLRATTRAPRR